MSENYSHVFLSKMSLKLDPDTTSQKADTIILECTTGGRQNNTNSTH